VRRVWAIFITLALALGLGVMVGGQAQAAVPKSPCGEGGYYGGGDPPHPLPFRGSLLVERPSGVPKSVDKNHDRWVCWTQDGYTDDKGKLPVPSKAEELRGDISVKRGPVCCDDDVTVDVKRHRVWVVARAVRGDENFRLRSLHYDGNDVFYLDGQRVSTRTFERRAIDGFVFWADYTPTSRKTSVWSIYVHEV
jgi:hypothetical protein